MIRPGLPFPLVAALAWLSCANAPPARELPLDAGPVACDVELTWRQEGVPVRVFAAGDWNGFSATADELLTDGQGISRLALKLLPGEYAYRFRVEGDGLSPWRLDPSNPWRATWEGAEVSGLRVEDCRLPRLSPAHVQVDGAAGSFRAELAYDGRLAGALTEVSGTVTHGGRSRALGADELVVDAGLVRVALDFLARGKHVVRLRARGASGEWSQTALLPFWSEEAPFSWDGALLYMAVTDRYRDGDPSNNPPAGDASPGAGWNGGDLDGVRASVEDGTLAGLGVGALWLTPFARVPEGTGLAADAVHRVSGYHGYWPVEPTGVDERLGGPVALDRLVEAAHARGVRVMLDAVINHVHAEHPYVTAHPEWFPAGCTCGTTGCDWTDRRLQCHFQPYLPDVDWANPAARARFIEDVVAQVERFDLDGVRMDAVKHVPDYAVRDLSVRLRERFEGAGTKLFLMGETAMGWDPNAGPSEGGNVDNYGVISRYVGPHALDGQFDFPLYFAAAQAFTEDVPGRGMDHVERWTRASEGQYPAGAVMTPYVGSHDVARFITRASDPARAWSAWDNLPAAPGADGPYDRMYVALGWLMSLPGMPLLYMGDEYGDYGGADPDNRHPWRPRAELSAREARQLDRVSALARARQSLPGLRSRVTRTLLVDSGAWVAARGEGDERVLVVLYRGTGAATLQVELPEEWGGGAWIDAVAPGEAFPVTAGKLGIPVQPWSVRYLRR